MCLEQNSGVFFCCPTQGAQRLGWSQGKLQKSTLKPVPKLRHPPGVVELVSPGVHLLPRLKTLTPPFPKPTNWGEMRQVWQISGWWFFTFFIFTPDFWGKRSTLNEHIFFQMTGENHQVDSGVVVTLLFFFGCWIEKCVCRRRNKFSWITKFKTKSWCKLIERPLSKTVKYVKLWSESDVALSTKWHSRPLWKGKWGSYPHEVWQLAPESSLFK